MLMFIFFTDLNFGLENRMSRVNTRIIDPHKPKELCLCLNNDVPGMINLQMSLRTQDYGPGKLPESLEKWKFFF